MTGLLLVARHACSQALRGRRGVALVLLALLPVALALLNVRFSDRITLTHYLGAVLMGTFQFVVPFGALFLGVAVLGDEIEGRTITYLFTRPVPRPAVFLGRYLGSSFAFLVLLSVSLLATAAVFSRRIDLSVSQVLGTLAVAGGGFLAYAAFLAALRAFVERALFVGFLLGFILEGMVSKMPATGISRVSLWHHLALLETRLFEPGSYALPDLLGGLSADETAAGSIAVLAAVVAAGLLAGMWRVRTSEIRVPAAVA